jgi:photosystem II stability/assembly factor-like uncharacterized protein
MLRRARAGALLAVVASSAWTASLAAQSSSASSSSGSSAALSAGQSRPRVSAQSAPTKQLIQAVHAVDDRVVWASGHGGVVLRTLDGGAHWSLRPTPAGDSLQFRDVHALNANTAWIMSAGTGRASRIYRTNDGGVTWSLQFANRDTAVFFDCLTFLDRTTGVVFSDASENRTRVLRTANGGAAWEWLPTSAVPAPLPGEGAFASSGLCVVATSASNAFIATGPPSARLLRSRDAGRTWTADSTPFVRGESAGLTGLAFKDDRRGIAVAAHIGQLRTDTSRAVVGVTEDGGRSWTMRPRPPLPGALSGVAWVPGAGSDVAVVVGFGGAFVTADAGRSWQTLNNQVFTGVAAHGRTAWIAGGNGQIMRLDW